MLCIYYILLYKYTNQEDIIVGSPVSGRLYNELQPLFGVFVNSLPLKNTITPNITFDELLESVKNTCVNAFAHQDYPLDILINDLNISRDSSRSPLFDTMFAYQNIDNINIKIDEKKSKVIVAKSNTSKFDITLEIVPKDGFLKLSYEYCTKLFDESFIKQFAKHYENILLYILDMPKCKISDISILDIDEKNQILVSFATNTFLKAKPTMDQAHRVRSVMQNYFFIKEGAITISPEGVLSRNTISKGFKTPNPSMPYLPK